MDSKLPRKLQGIEAITLDLTRAYGRGYVFLPSKEWLRRLKYTVPAVFNILASAEELVKKTDDAFGNPSYICAGRTDEIVNTCPKKR